MSAAAAPATSIAVDWFRGIFRNIFFALEALRPHGRLPASLVPLVFHRVHRIYHLVIRIADLVQAGRYRPRRRSGRPPRQAIQRTKSPSPLPPKYGWLAALMPATAPGCRGDLDSLLRRPDMIALIEAAPVTLIPPLRSLCWALQLEPPAILARPRRPAPPPDSPLPSASAAPQPTLPSVSRRSARRPAPPSRPQSAAPPVPVSGHGSDPQKNA